MKYRVLFKSAFLTILLNNKLKYRTGFKFKIMHKKHIRI